MEAPLNRRSFVKDSLMGTAAFSETISSLQKAGAALKGTSAEAAAFETPAASSSRDIRELSQHFNKPGADISSWIFVPEENIKEISTTDSPGLAAIWQAGKGKDIKGILKEPIRIDYGIPIQKDVNKGNGKFNFNVGYQF